MAYNPQRYSVDINNSVYTSYEVENGVYVFNVEQGRRFSLKFSGNAGSPDLYQNGQKLTYSRFGTININSNSVVIQAVGPEHKGNYKIRSSNGAELTFRLRVTTTYGYRQRPNEHTWTGDPW